MPAGRPNKVEIAQSLDRARAILKDTTIAGDDKLWRLSSLCDKALYRQLYRDVTGKGAITTDTVQIKMAVLYGAIVKFTPREKWPSIDGLERKFEEAVKMTEEKTPVVEKKAAEPKVPGQFGKHRSMGIGDEVAKELAECKTVTDMVAFAKKAGMEEFKRILNREPQTDKEKTIALQDADKYLALPNPGLLRMSIGNRLRGMEKKLTHRAGMDQKKAARAAAKEKEKQEKELRKAEEQKAKEAAKADKAAAQTTPAEKKLPKLKKA